MGLFEMNHRLEFNISPFKDFKRHGVSPLKFKSDLTTISPLKVKSDSNAKSETGKSVDKTGQKKMEDRSSNVRVKNVQNDLSIN